MISPLENLYQETDPEPVFAQPVSAGPASANYEHSVDPLLVPARKMTPLDQVEEGELSELEDQLEQDISNNDCIISQYQNYRETVRGVRAFMGWSHISDLEYSPTTRANNPWIGHRTQPKRQVSVLLPLED